MKQLRLTVLAFLGLTSFMKTADGKEFVTEEQKALINKSLGEDLGSEFVVALEKEGDGDQLDQAANAALLSKLTAHYQKSLALTVTVDQLTAKVGTLQSTVTQQAATINILSAKPEDETPGKASSGNAPWKPSGNDSHLFGENHPHLAIDSKHPYNQRAYAMLAAKSGLMVHNVEGSLDYSSLAADLGDYYRVRKQDRIQSFLLELPSLTKFFSLESNYQDQAALVNLFLTEDFSQADSTAVGSSFENVVKGGYKFEPEILTMYDVMFVHQFSQLKQLEKSWLGYLNREGSSTMKWSFIEYILLETAKKLKNEQELRRIRGIRKNPTANVPGESLQASNGLSKYIKNQIAAFKIRPFELGQWNAGNICDYIYRGTQMVPQVLRDSGRIVVYMSTDALAVYNKGLRILYGENTDFSGSIAHVFEYPGVQIKAIPGLAPSQRMIWTFEGNIALFEDKPGEMLAFNIEQKDWTLKVWSNWRESIWAYYVGRKYNSLAEIPEDFSTQLIFVNDVDEPANYYLAMDANDTTPSVVNHTSLVTVANSQATAITNIDDAVVGQTIRLKWAAGTNLPTIAKAGNFSLLPSAISSPEVGDIVYLMKREDGKFLQVKIAAVVSEDAIVIADGDATPSVADGTKFITSPNTSALAITGFDDAEYEVSFTVYGGSDTNAATIANAGNFVLTAAMTLGAGTFIKLQKMADDKFYEISRG
jgi:hypothetical protein